MLFACMFERVNIKVSWVEYIRSHDLFSTCSSLYVWGGLGYIDCTIDHASYGNTVCMFEVLSCVIQMVLYKQRSRHGEFNMQCSVDCGEASALSTSSTDCFEVHTITDFPCTREPLSIEWNMLLE